MTVRFAVCYKAVCKARLLLTYNELVSNESTAHK